MRKSYCTIRPLIRENIDIEKIAGTLGLKYWVDDKGFRCIEIGEADWDNTGNEMDLVIKYRHGAYCNEWKRTGINDNELTAILQQTVGTYSTTSINTYDQAFTFLAGLVLVRRDIAAWRLNHMKSEYNRDIERVLDCLR